MTEKFFNTAGPCRPDIHYMLGTKDRLPEVMHLIEQESYFVLHAPRQIGKTTTMIQLAQELTASGRYAAVVLSLETGSPFSGDPLAAQWEILKDWRGGAPWQLPPELQPEYWPPTQADAAIGAFLARWAKTCPRPLVVLLDETDSLQDAALTAILRQLRSGYPQRPRGFPMALGLIGMRDVRDYKVKSGGSERLHTASPFNIKARSLTLSNFTAAEVQTLYAQHTAATGQQFADEALARAFDLTQGQPYLVNALAKIAVEELVTDQARPVTFAHIDEAKETMILRRETHLDSLAERLREDRIRRVIEAVLIGSGEATEIPKDDLNFVRDLGLITLNGQIAIANPIYQEVIPRELTYGTQYTIAHKTSWYVDKDGRLMTEKLMEAFQEFFRENSERWLEQFAYKEAGPQLLLQAFLQRIVNGGGRVEPEYGLGRRRVDLLVKWPTSQGEQRIVMELKLLRGSLAKTLEVAIPQTWDYGDKAKAEELHLVIFDRETKKPWSKKLFKKTKQHRGRKIMVWGM